MFTKQVKNQQIGKGIDPNHNPGVTGVGDSQQVRKKLTSNHNQTLVGDSQQVRQGIDLNHNQTLVSETALTSN